jgi:hypothetical protein
MWAFAILAVMLIQSLHMFHSSSPHKGDLEHHYKAWKATTLIEVITARDWECSL